MSTKLNKRMKISEVPQTDSREEFLDQYQSVFARVTPSPAFAMGDVEVFKAFSPEDRTHYNDCFGLLIDGEVVAILVTSKDRLGIAQIEKSITDPKYRGKGFFRYLLNMAAKQFGEVLSDDHQTPEARRSWEGLVKLPGGTLDITVYDPGTGEYSKYDESVWNDDGLLLSAKRKNTQIDEMMSPRNVHHRYRKTGRDHHSLFYGIEFTSAYNP